MAIRQNKTEILDEFVEQIYTEIKSKYSEDAGIKNVLCHLIDSGMVDPKRIRDYMVLSDFSNLLRDNEGHFTYTFMDLSIKYDISDRTARNIIYQKRKTFKPEYNKR